MSVLPATVWSHGVPTLAHQAAAHHPVPSHPMASPRLTGGVHPLVAPPVAQLAPFAPPAAAGALRASEGVAGGSGNFPSSRPAAVASPNSFRPAALPGGAAEPGSFARPTWTSQQAPSMPGMPGMPFSRSSGAPSSADLRAGDGHDPVHFAVRGAEVKAARWESTGGRTVASLSTEVSAAGSAQLAMAPSAGSLVSNSDPQVGALRSEIEGLRAELDALKTLLDEGVQQREETERNQSALITRVEQLSSYKLHAEQQMREAHAETQWLRKELARRQRQSAEPELGELDRPLASPTTAKPAMRPSSSWSPPKQQSAPPSPPRKSPRGHGEARSYLPPTTSMSRSSSFKQPEPPSNGTDEVDEMWRCLLQRFPQYPHWCLVKERRCVYRMASQTGKKVVCRVSPGGLQVRVGGGWMAALPFLERYGPLHMGARSGEDPHFNCTSVDLPPSMERLLVPTKSWAQRIGIRKMPDLREQRRLQDPRPEARQSWSGRGASAAAPSSAPCAEKRSCSPGRLSEPTEAQVPAAETTQVLQPLPWPADGRHNAPCSDCSRV